MPLYFEPHTIEWFQALDAFDPRKAEIAREAIRYASRDDVCSICAACPAQDYESIDKFMADNAIATIRLCNDCLGYRRLVDKETFIPYKARVKGDHEILLTITLVNNVR